MSRFHCSKWGIFNPHLAPVHINNKYNFTYTFFSIKWIKVDFLWYFRGGNDDDVSVVKYHRYMRSLSSTAWLKATRNLYCNKLPTKKKRYIFCFADHYMYTCYIGFFSFIIFFFKMQLLNSFGFIYIKAC